VLKVRPFRPLRYDPAVVGDLAAVVAPPYDVISDEHRDRLYERNDYNVVRLILNRDADRYATAARLLADWKARGVLTSDDEPALCYYVEEFQLPDGSSRQRRGILGAVRLEAPESGIIRPHERTFARAKEDRMRVLEACRTNLSPIFGLLSGAQGLLDPARAAAEARTADIDLRDDGDNRHQLWFLRDPRVAANVAEALAPESVVIADGHHRYATALAYGQRLRQQGHDDPEAAHNFMLMYLTSMWDPGLVVLPTHRILADVHGLDAKTMVERLQGDFDLLAVHRSRRQEFEEQLEKQEGQGCIGVALRGSEDLFVAVVKDTAVMDEAAADLSPLLRRLDVSILDVLVLQRALGMSAVEAVHAGNLSYTHSDDEALDAIEQNAQAAFLLRPPRMQDVLAVCGSGETMPEKSTYFYPKLLSGLVFHPLD
jgi:uncharacterized protein (DUF1015 family)